MSTRAVQYGTGVALVVFACSVTLILGWSWIGPVLTDSNAPAWVQAIGSMLAIVAAFIVGGWQARVTLRAVTTSKQTDQVDAAMTALVLGGASEIVQRSLCDRISTNVAHFSGVAAGNEMTFERDQVVYLCDALDRLQLNQMPASCTLYVVLLSSHARVFRNHLNAAIAEHIASANAGWTSISNANYELLCKDLEEQCNRTTQVVGSLDKTVVSLKAQYGLS